MSFSLEHPFFKMPELIAHSPFAMLCCFQTQTLLFAESLPTFCFRLTEEKKFGGSQGCPKGGMERKKEREGEREGGSERGREVEETLFLSGVAAASSQS